MDENEQCRDRAMKSTYMLPYSWSIEEEKTNFAGAIATPLNSLQEAGLEFDFDPHDIVVRLYGVSGGRVGIVMRVLHGAIAYIANDVLSYACLAKAANSVLQAQHRPDFFFESDDIEELDWVRSFVNVMKEADLEIAPSTTEEFSVLEHY